MRDDCDSAMPMQAIGSKIMKLGPSYVTLTFPPRGAWRFTVTTSHQIYDLHTSISHQPLVKQRRWRHQWTQNTEISTMVPLIRFDSVGHPPSIRPPRQKKSCTVIPVGTDPSSLSLSVSLGCPACRLSDEVLCTFGFETISISRKQFPYR